MAGHTIPYTTDIQSHSNERDERTGVDRGNKEAIITAMGLSDSYKEGYDHAECNKL
jgi:hypothetical protein